jgi:hypothetical protein
MLNSQVVDYTTQDVAELYSAPEQQFDIAIDCMGTRSEFNRPRLTMFDRGHRAVLRAAGDFNCLLLRCPNKLFWTSIPRARP